MIEQRLPSRTDQLASEGTMPIPGGSLGLDCGCGLTAALHSTDGVQVVVLDGIVGADSRFGLYSALNAAFMSRPHRMLIDASCVTDCDRQGLTAFIDAAERAEAGGIPLTLCGLPAPHRQMLSQLWGPRVAEALSYLCLQDAFAAVLRRPAASDPSRDELLEDIRHLHEALTTSRVTEQARGVLMGIYGLTADAALELLWRHSRIHDVGIRSLAERLLDVVQHSPAGTAPSRDMEVLLDDLTTAPDQGPSRRPAWRITETASA